MAEVPLFSSVPSAVKWAEELATRAHRVDSIGQLLKKRGGGTYTWDEMVDLALSITGKVSACGEYRGVAMKCVYGYPARETIEELAEFMADRIVERHGDVVRSKKTKDIRAVCEAAVMSERNATITGRKLSLSKIAGHIGIPRQRMHDTLTWLELVNAAGEELGRLLDQCEAEIRYDLEAMGVV